MENFKQHFSPKLSKIAYLRIISIYCAFCAEEFAQAWTPHSEITHRVNVRPYVSAKKSAIRAHASQAHADGTVRTLGVLSALPTPLFAALLGTEYYVKV